MYMIARGMDEKWRFLAYLYCFFGIFAAFGVGNATQINAVVTGVNQVIAGFGGAVTIRRNLGIGLLLDYSADGATYDWGDFRFAWLALGAVWAAGFIGLLASRRAVRKSLEPMTTELK